MNTLIIQCDICSEDSSNTQTVIVGNDNSYSYTENEIDVCSDCLKMEHKEINKEWRNR